MRTKETYVNDALGEANVQLRLQLLLHFRQKLKTALVICLKLSHTVPYTAARQQIVAFLQRIE